MRFYGSYERYVDSLADDLKWMGGDDFLLTGDRGTVARVGHQDAGRDHQREADDGEHDEQDGLALTGLTSHGENLFLGSTVYEGAFLLDGQVHDSLVQA